MSDLLKLTRALEDEINALESLRVRSMEQALKKDDTPLGMSFRANIEILQDSYKRILRGIN